MLSGDLDSILRSQRHTDPDAEMRSAYLAQFKPGRIDPATNRGIRLGMTPAEVKRILGPPTNVVQGKVVKGLQLIYRRPNAKTSRGRRSFVEYYAFRNGRLFFIEHANSSLEGG